MQAKFDALVVGAGIVGTACARELASNGMCVAICEASDHVGGGATAAGMGHLAVMDDSEAQFALTSYSQGLWQELSPGLPCEAEYLPCGSLWVAADEEELTEAQRKFEFYDRRGVPVELLDQSRLAEAEPELRAGLAGALLMPQDSVCYPPAAAFAFAEEVTRQGGEVLLGRRVTGLPAGGVSFANGEMLKADIRVLAAGTLIGRLLPKAKVQPRKGHLLITDRCPGFLRHQLIELGYLKSAHSTMADSVAFNAQPRATGQILIGSSRQFGSQDGAIEEQMLSRMLRRAISYMPRLGSLSAVRGWTGFRAATPDKLPLIGRCEDQAGLFVATGHEGLGISTSLATARLLADEILGRPSIISREPYRPGRVFAAHD